MRTEQPRVLSMSTKYAPYSLDPMIYDFGGHHLAFTSVFAPLVSEYQRGSVLGIVAESWVSSDNFKTWEFLLRDGMTFSNGDAITPTAVLKSLKRAAFLQRLSNSKSGLFEHLIGLDSFHSMSDNLEGMTLDGRKLVLKFHQPIPKLLGSISFGLYAITHPDDYDSETGKWKDPRQGKASGAYQVAEWTDDHLTLALRDAFPKHLRHARAWPEVQIHWNPKNFATTNIGEGDSFSNPRGDDFEFLTTSATTVSISYVQCFTWRRKGSPCNDLQTRRMLRHAFYQSIESKGFTPSRSFFPRQLTNFVGSQEITERSSSIGHNKDFRIILGRRPYPPFSLAVKALQESARELHLTPQTVATSGETLVDLITDTLPNPPFDSGVVVTGILLEDSRDARFMIQSKEGIRLPDPDGRLHEEAAKPDLDYDKLEEILWDQAIIWPLTHFQDGLWVKKGSFDFSQINLNLPATDFSRIGMKK